MTLGFKGLTVKSIEPLYIQCQGFLDADLPKRPYTQSMSKKVEASPDAELAVFVRNARARLGLAEQSWVKRLVERVATFPIGSKGCMSLPIHFCPDFR